MNALSQIKSTKPDKYTPRIVEDKGDYIRVEYQSPILGVSNRKTSSISYYITWLVFNQSLALWMQLVDDVEFWFPPAKNSVVEYRSASRQGNFDFDVNRKRIKVQY